MEADSTPLQANTRRFWELPQEVIDLIFDFTYGAGNHKKVLDRSAWERAGNGLRRAGENGVALLDERSFDEALKVNEFLVSKKWFRLAARAWVDGKEWWDIGPFLAMRIPLFVHFVKKIDITLEHCDIDLLRSLLTYCPHLQAKFDIKINTFDLHGREWAGKEPWIEERSRGQLETFKVVRELKTLRGLQHFSLTSDTWDEGPQSRHHRHIWQKNIQAVDNIIRPLVTLPGTKCRTKAPEGPTPLYMGSRVTCDRSDLLPADFWNVKLWGPWSIGSRYVVNESYWMTDEEQKEVNKKYAKAANPLVLKVWDEKVERWTPGSRPRIGESIPALPWDSRNGKSGVAMASLRRAIARLPRFDRGEGQGKRNMERGGQ